ncbi:MAG TPA: SRPBCC family protein [Segeticoccus sp.]|uniref:SRPBCC family protein n=1 Tax=Segeticoccus sp. TaxID=2706531 RepID=UPI002D7FB207|nr:SRPBCC family protein [Segeticoccus sp.]HET8600348.1 SRPBCC family protein [Segeticoccus sp.]
MNVRSQHLSIAIERPADVVYDYAADPRNLPTWAAGLAGATVEQSPEGEWSTQSPMGRVTVRFASRNQFGVLDHEVVLPSGESVLNPMRVIPDGADECEVVFTLRLRPGMSDAEFAADAAAVHEDLARLKAVLEGR